jgi:hypothetical protein
MFSFIVLVEFSTKRHLSGPMPVQLLSHPDDLVVVTVDGATFSFFIVFAGVHARMWFCDFVLHVCLLSGQYALQAVRPGSQWTNLGSSQRHEWDFGFCQKHCSFLSPTLEITSCPRGSHGRLSCLRLPRKQLQHRLCAKYRG